MDFREEFEKTHPNEKIEVSHCYSSEHAVSRYAGTWSKSISVEDLINYADNSTGNYGGRLESVTDNGDGTCTGIICVYYD